MPTLKELRQLGQEELEAQLAEMQRSYFDLRRRHATKELQDSSSIRAERRAIAQVKTLLREKNLAEGRA